MKIKIKSFYIHIVFYSGKEDMRETKRVQTTFDLMKKF